MSATECRACSEQTLHDKTVAQRLRALKQLRGRRGSRVAASFIALGLIAASSAAALAPAQAGAATQAYGGFSVASTASPLKLEVFEPAIPIPTEPQFELDFSYTRVLGD